MLFILVTIGLLAYYTAGLLSTILWVVFYSLLGIVCLSMVVHGLLHLVTGPDPGLGYEEIFKTPDLPRPVPRNELRGRPLMPRRSAL